MCTPDRVVSGGFAPVLGAVHEDDMGGAKRVEQDNDRLARDTEGFRDRDSCSEKPQFGIGCSIQPSVTVPATVRISVMTDSSYLAVGHPQGEPATFIAVDDPHPIWKALTIAFGSEYMPVHGKNGTPGITRGRL